VDGIWYSIVADAERSWKQLFPEVQYVAAAGALVGKLPLYRELLGATKPQPEIIDVNKSVSCVALAPSCQHWLSCELVLVVAGTPSGTC
jgi:hypothetical protein